MSVLGLQHVIVTVPTELQYSFQFGVRTDDTVFLIFLCVVDRAF